MIWYLVREAHLWAEFRQAIRRYDCLLPLLSRDLRDITVAPNSADQRGTAHLDEASSDTIVIKKLISYDKAVV